ncbi:MAG: prolipoprotein diacylglyceryl transferase, partial [Candidatus Amulumruptor sp.]|nr:prolipoprotein diacylglyceryl transferase [Candidatus Amulumruptor sp.]
LILIGNLMNSEIYCHATDLPWGFMFIRSAEWHALYEGQGCHPTQLYEAACYFALFALLMWMYWKKNAEERPGLIFGVFFTVLFTCRVLIEFIKNPQVAFEQDMVLNMGQLLSLPFIAIGIGLIIYAMVRPKVKLTFPNRYADEPESSKR